MSRYFQKPHVLLLCDCKKAFVKTPDINYLFNIFASFLKTEILTQFL